MRFCYIRTKNNYAPDKHLIDGLGENGHTVIEIIEENLGIKKYAQLGAKFLKNKGSCDAVIVGYTLPHFVPLIRFLTRKKIIFSAVASQYEASVISRNNQNPWSLRAVKMWLIDFFSFHLSSKILLESGAQVNFLHDLLIIPRKKLVRSWIGVDEKVFFRDPSIKKHPKFTVLFRGKFLPESGIDTIIRAAKLLENKEVYFLIIGHGFLYKIVNSLIAELKPKNLSINQEILPNDELRENMLPCHVSLGQLAQHPRLSRTLPFKLYESLALGLPYLTGKNPAILELLKDGTTCVTVEPGSPAELANKILFLKNNPAILKKIGEMGYKLYKEKLTSKKLAQGFIESCF